MKLGKAQVPLELAVTAHEKYESGVILRGLFVTNTVATCFSSLKYRVFGSLVDSLQV